MSDDRKTEPSPSLPKNKQKKLSEGMNDLRKRFKRRTKADLVEPPITPRYDEVYEAGSIWLD